MPNAGARPVAGYIRVSRIGGRSGEGFISPDEQRVQIERYADELGLRVATWGDDQDYSGGNFERPAWEDIIAKVEAGELGGVLVLRVDRFARNVPDGAAQIRHIVDECKGIFGSAQERMDPSTPAGRYMLQQFLNNAELQLNMLKGSWKVAKERAIKRGAHIGPTPLGYGRVPKGELRSGCLYPLSEWEPVIREIFRFAASTKAGNKVIANHMNSGFPRPDGRRWTATTVGHVLANRVYLGEISYRPRKGDFVPLVNIEAHDPMIDEPTWLTAQRTPGKQRTNAGRTNLLAGLIRCAGCRYRMCASRGAKNARVYRCSGDHGGGKCPAPAVILADRVEQFALREVQDQWEARFAVTLRQGGTSAEADEIAARVAQARAELDAFANDLSARRLLGAGYHAALETRVNAVSVAEAEWANLSSAEGRVDASEISWATLDRAEVRDLLGGALDAVFIRRGRNLAVEDRACLVWTGELDDDVPARGKVVSALRPFEWPENDRASFRVAAP